MSAQLQTQAKTGSKSPDAPTANNAVKRHFSGQRGFSAEAQRYLIQAKLKIGQPGDKYELEADQVAEQVMRMPEPKVQRMCSEYKEELKRQPLEEEEELQANPVAGQITPLIQRQVEEEEEEELIQTKIVGDVTPKVTPAINSGIQSLQGGGRPMSRGELSFFEPRFGTDFSNVRVHNDSHAASVARSVNARAFTLGHNVVFGIGEYSPDASSGRKLLAHELTHVIQQNGGLTHFSTNKITENSIPDSQGLSIAPELTQKKIVNTQSTNNHSFRVTPLQSKSIQFTPLFNNCTPSITGRTYMTQSALNTLIDTARNNAITMTGGALRAISEIRQTTPIQGFQRALPSYRAALTDNFGQNTETSVPRLSTITTYFTNAKDNRLPHNSHLRCVGASATAARTTCADTTIGNLSAPTNLYPSFFMDPMPCMDPTRICVLVHEAAHASGAANDYYHGGGSYPPADAENNAPSYARFAETVAYIDYRIGRVPP